MSGTAQRGSVTSYHLPSEHKAISREITASECQAEVEELEPDWASPELLLSQLENLGSLPSSCCSVIVL